nr:O-antigen ligase family protein [Paracoccaceae bacterium]
MNRYSAGPPFPVRAADRSPAGAMVLTIAPTAVVAWLCLAMLQLTFLVGTLAALVFLIGGLWLLVHRLPLTFAAVQAEIWVVAIALWCIVTMAWSYQPAATLRFGMLLLFTILVGVVLAYRLSPLVFLKAVFGCYLFAGVLSLLIGVDRADGLGFRGIYGSKNAMAQMCSVFVVAALALTLDRSLGRGLRLFAAGALVLAVVLLLRAQSVGALLVAFAAVFVMLSLPLLRRIGPWARTLLGSLTVLVTALCAIAVLTNLADFGVWFVETTGRDLTLTGRTHLWGVAFQEIAARPFLGTGFQAFWVHGNPIAEDLWAMFGIASRQGFHFHNAVISNAVELGLPAALFQAGLV